MINLRKHKGLTVLTTICMNYRVVVGVLTQVEAHEEVCHGEVADQKPEQLPCD